MEKTLEGRYAYLDSFGRLYFDKCPTPQAHLTVISPPDEERRRCCTSVDELLPPGSIGKKGTWKFKIEFIPEE